MKPLSDSSEKLRAAILSDFDHDETFEAILDAGLRARDLYHEAQSLVDKEGLTVQGDRGGIKAHPLLSVIRDSRSQFLAALKQLKIDVIDDNVRTPGRPTAYERHVAGKGW